MRVYSCTDGQCIASRLSKSLNQETVKLKQFVQMFNNLPGERQITWEDGTDLSSSLLCHSTVMGVPRNIKLSAIKYHHLALRSDEDINLLKNEMHSTFCFFLEDWKHLLSTIDEFKTKPCSQYYNGALNQLQLACLKCEGLLLDLRSAFNTFVDLPVLPVDEFMSKILSIPTKTFEDVEDVASYPNVEEVSSNLGDML